MKHSLQPGLTADIEITVDDTRSISFMGEGIEVYATPWIVSDLEYACRDLLLPHLSHGQDSVGARVEIDHLKPTPRGFSARHKIVVSAVEGRRITFDIEVFDAAERVAVARHVRFVVDVGRLRRAVEDKRQSRPSQNLIG